MRIIAQVVIGYMYKVLKNGKNTSKFHKEFAAIRHGDYSDFLNLIGEEIDFVVSYKSGAINTDTNIREDDSDFGRLFKSGKSLKKFLNNCYSEFGEFEDEVISIEVYEKLALFELSLRMHRNNNSPRVDRITLENVINELKEIKGLSDSDCKLLHKGRKFLNNVKRPEKMKDSWEGGVNDFHDAYSVLQSQQLTII
jgi:hypothetical protein